jgi:Fe-Mn family superoxide dismutase
MPFELPKLSYEYDALEPVIDAKTMEIHHTKHHAGYTNKLNAALEKHPELESLSIEEILKKLDEVPEEIRTAVRNNGGGFYNHSLYWEVMAPGGAKKPEGDLANMIDEAFGSFDELKDIFQKEALGRFGSGWAWLASDANKDLEVISTPNQDSPISSGLTPILGVDVWEHAYYLNYQNKRADYVKAWWDIINWDVVTAKYQKV